MTKFRKLTDNFTVIPNQLFALDISPEAKYIYVYLRSKPETWVPHMVEIQRSTGMGRAKTMRCRRELIDSGLLSYQAKGEGGGVYTLHELSDVRKPNNGKADTQKADSGKADSGFSNPLVSTDLLVSTDSKKPFDQIAFDQWWAAYPKKVGKKLALAAWKKLKPDDDLVATLIADTKKRLAHDRKWIDGFIKDPVRYLKHEQWNDAIDHAPAKSQTLPNDMPGLEAIAVEKGMHPKGCAPQNIQNVFQYKSWIQERL